MENISIKGDFFIRRSSDKNRFKDSKWSPSDERDLYKILDHIYIVTGFKAHQYRLSTLRSRFKLRLSVTGSGNYENYLGLLIKDASECFRFLDTLTINVTDFFRDAKVFSVLTKKILPDMLRELSAKKRKRVRIWSIGCSRGHEPYSIAFILHELIRKNWNGMEFFITATDVKKDVLEQAKRARYSREEIQNIPKKYIREHLITVNREEFAIKNTIKRSIRFRYHDLINGKSLGTFDLILCRNLFIFFEQQLQNEMLNKIYASLKNNGLLIMGTAESPKKNGLFRCISSRDHVYQKVPCSFM